MNVVIVDGDISYPLTSGKRLRTHHLMVRMARRGHRITYVCRGHGRPDEARQSTAYFQQQGIDTIVVDDPVPAKSGWRFYARLAGNLISPRPYAVAAHDSYWMRERVQDLARRQRVDLWQFEWTPYAEALPWAPRFRKLINAHNVDSLIWERYYQAESNPARRWYIKHQWRKFQDYERHVFPQATRIMTVSEDDAVIVREQFGMPRVDVVDNGIDKDYFAAAPSERQANRILFLGSLEWRPNQDAVSLLLETVFPAVRAEIPAARLCIVGSNPPAWLSRRMQESSGVELHANVPDIRPFLGQSSVMTVPLRIGGGSRLKILEALASGLPVVSTRVGAEGLCLRPGQDLVVVDRPDEMSAALVRCLRAPAAAQEMAQRGREVVQRNYDWNVLADKLGKVWEKCV